MAFASAILVTILLTSLTTSYIITDTSEDSQPFFEEISAPIDGTLKRPQGVAVNTTGHILVADTGNSIIQVFDASGVFVGTYGSADESLTTGALNRPFDIYVNSTNFEFVVDTFTGAIKVYNNSTYVETLGSPGTGGAINGTAEFYRPMGMTSNTTHIFVADTFNNRILIMNYSGIIEDIIP